MDINVIVEEIRNNCNDELAEACIEMVTASAKVLELYRKRIKEEDEKRNNRRIRYDGKSLTIREWADETGIPYTILVDRIIVNHWRTKDALTVEEGGVRPRHENKCPRGIRIRQMNMKSEPIAEFQNMAECSRKIGLSYWEIRKSLAEMSPIEQVGTRGYYLETIK